MYQELRPMFWFSQCQLDFKTFHVNLAIYDFLKLIPLKTSIRHLSFYEAMSNHALMSFSLSYAFPFLQEVLEVSFPQSHQLSHCAFISTLCKWFADLSIEVWDFQQVKLTLLYLIGELLMFHQAKIYMFLLHHQRPWLQ